MNNVFHSFLKDIYDKPINLLLKSSEIKEIEDFYQKYYQKYTDIKMFYSVDKNIARKIKKVCSVRAEIERQFFCKKRLQSGTLCECVLAESIARFYQLDSFADVFHTYIRDLPANILYRLRDDNNRILCRYIYYNKNDLNTFLIQYGNPTRYDADFYMNGEKIKLEFKDRIARAGEKETEYDDEGKLVYSHSFQEENPTYISLIHQFNEKNNIIDLVGNYKIESDSDKKEILKSYFKSLGFDILISMDLFDSIIAITYDCIDKDDCCSFISFDGSEIRRSGKNSYTVFTPNLLLKSIHQVGGIISGNSVKIPSSNMINRMRNDKITGRKINHLFYVRLESLKEKNGYCEFLIKDVKQLKPTICVHIQIIAERSRLREYYLSH